MESPQAYIRRQKRIKNCAIVLVMGAISCTILAIIQFIFSEKIGEQEVIRLFLAVEDIQDDIF